MNHIQKGLSALSLAVLFTAGLPAHAALITLPTASAHADATVSAEGSVTTKAPTIAPGTVLNGIVGGSNVKISNVSITPAQRLTTTKSEVPSRSGMKSATATTLSVDRSTDRSMGTTSASTTINSSNDVLSKADLQAYISTMIKKEKALHSANFTDSSVQLTYGEPGKLFGFIPVTMNATVKTDKDGNIVVRYPWYHKMVKARNSEDVQTNVAAYTKLMLSHTASTTDSTTFTVRAQARLFDQLRLALEGAGQVDTYGTSGQ